MRIRIKAPAGLSTSGIYGADGKEIEVGTVIDVKEEPLALAGRYEVISGSTEGKTPVLNPAPGQPINKASDSTDGENPFPGAESAPQSQMDGKAATPSTDAGDAELDRDDLKKQADELGIQYPSNVKTTKLKELIDAKLSE